MNVVVTDLSVLTRFGLHLRFYCHPLVNGIKHGGPHWASFVCWVVVSLAIDAFLLGSSSFLQQT